MTEYTAATTNASNKVTATPVKGEATVMLMLNGAELVNGANASWEDGENVLTCTVIDGTETKTYTVTVTKS